MRNLSYLLSYFVIRVNSHGRSMPHGIRGHTTIDSSFLSSVKVLLKSKGRINCTSNADNCKEVNKMD